MDRKKRLDLVKVYDWFVCVIIEHALTFHIIRVGFFIVTSHGGKFPHGFLKNYLVEWKRGGC